MPIELVDKIDSAQRGTLGNPKPPPGTRRYQQGGPIHGGFVNDLFLDEERGDDSSVSSIQTSGDEYVGLELEMVMEKREMNRKKRRLLVMGLVLMVNLIVAAVFFTSRSQSRSASNTPSRSHPSTGPHPHSNPTTTSTTTHLSSPPSSPQSPPSSPTSAPDSPSSSTSSTQNNSDEDQVDVDTNFLWPTAAPNPKFDICAPKLSSRYFHHHERVHKMVNLIIVPEDEDNSWEYTFSALDMDEHASVLAVGLKDFGSSTQWSVGMVRVFAYSCHAKKYKQLGQDLLGSTDGESFGYRVSSSNDGLVMAITGLQENIDDETGFVQVYALDDDTQTWLQLGQRIDELSDTACSYTSLGAAIDLSDNGETLAVLATVSDTKFVIRVFDFDSNAQEWVHKGHDLVVEVDSSEEYDFDKQVALSNDGNQLSLIDPKYGLVQYSYDWVKNTWSQAAAKMTTLTRDDAEAWVESVSTDSSGDIVGFGVYEYGGDLETSVDLLAKLVDFSNASATVVYNQTTVDPSVTLNVAVSHDGTVAAILESKIDMDDNTVWEYDDIGSMTIVSKSNSGKWKVLSAGTNSEALGVEGSYVTLSGDGTIAVVGTDTSLTIYGVLLNHAPVNTSATASSDAAPTSAPSQNLENVTTFSLCAPFPDATQHVGDIDKLPKQPDEHTLSISLNADASIVAVGIDAWEDEDRGMVRVFGWDCTTLSYTPIGQDLFGTDSEDGYGQSVDLSADGKTMVIGANQPQPGKSGYVEIYALSDDFVWTLEDKFTEVHETVEDIGREVRISADGSTVAIHGSFVDSKDGGYLSSFIRIIEKDSKTKKWVNKGDDLMGSIMYDDYGTNTQLSFAADGTTLGVTGSYNSFTAKMYTWDASKTNWTETIIPPMKISHDSKDSEKSYDWDEECEEYFDGTDIALSDDGKSVAIAGTQWSESDAVVRLLTLGDDGSWTMSHDALDYHGDYATNSIGISGDSSILAVGINIHEDKKEEQGSMFVSQTVANATTWTTLGSIDGRNEKDLLGSRVAVSRDGRFCAASSRRGYVTFFGTGI